MIAILGCADSRYAHRFERSTVRPQEGREFTCDYSVFASLFRSYWALLWFHCSPRTTRPEERSKACGMNWSAGQRFWERVWSEMSNLSSTRDRLGNSSGWLSGLATASTWPESPSSTQSWNPLLFPRGYSKVSSPSLSRFRRQLQKTGN